MSVQIISSNIPSNAVTPERPSWSPVTPPINSASLPRPESLRSSEVQVDTVSQVKHTYQSLSETTAKINQVADSIRQADSTMEKVGLSVNMMKGSLESIVKNYPPFPPGSEQRIKALKDFAALRNEIEKLTFPPDTNQVTKLVADPAKAPGSFSVALDTKGTSVRLDRQQIDPGPNGLNIPVLPTTPPADSSDEPIHNAISSLMNAAKTISDRRQSLMENFSRQALPAVVASVTNQTSLSDATLGATSLTDKAASSKSLDISGIFSAIPVGMSVASDTVLKRLT